MPLPHPLLAIRNRDHGLKPILCTYKVLNHGRREWTSKWINYAPFGAKCWLRCNSGNRYNQRILSHFRQHMIPTRIALPSPKYLKAYILPSITIFTQILNNFIATTYRLLNLQETLISRVNHHIWITCITFSLCPLTPTWFLHIWWMNRRIKIKQINQEIFHLINHHFPHLNLINFEKRKLQKPQLLLLIKNHSHIQKRINFIPFLAILHKFSFFMFVAMFFKRVSKWEILSWITRSHQMPYNFGNHSYMEIPNHHWLPWS